MSDHPKISECLIVRFSEKTDKEEEAQEQVENLRLLGRSNSSTLSDRKCLRFKITR